MPNSVNAVGTALLLMDFQNDIVPLIAENKRSMLLSNAAALLARARQIGMPVFFVVVGFRDGYPEVNERNKSFSGIKAAGRMKQGTPGFEIDARIAPQANEAVIVKKRVNAFFNTDLETLLGARGVTRLILSGIATSGVILSTTRWAADRDYSIVVVSDACGDADDEVHRVLTEKVLARQASVVTTSALLAAPEFSA